MQTRTWYSDPGMTVIAEPPELDESIERVAAIRRKPAPRAAPAHPLQLPTAARRIRTIFGALLVAHGLAHAAPGMWAAGRAPAWFVTPLWLVAMCGFLAAGFGLLGVAGFRRRWPVVVTAAGVASLLVLLTVGGIPLAVGLVLDVALVLAVLEADATAGIPDVVVDADRARGGHRLRRAIGAALAWGLVAWTATAIALRPWHLDWGTTAKERALRLPGDNLLLRSHYRMDRAVTIDAPADAVWPWLVQIGQDRAGFYSYDRLERLIGDDIRNADRIHPEWQHLQRGDLVRAAQPDYLGGVLGDSLGWRVVDIESGRSLLLEGWGAFVLHPQADGTTRLHVRMRQPGEPSLTGVALGALGLLVFEPAHFIMERGMLLGIKARAEGASR